MLHGERKIGEGRPEVGKTVSPGKVARKMERAVNEERV